MDVRRVAVSAVDPASIGSEPELEARLRAEIADGGPITFARFMERALYEPGLGYYRGPTARPGRAGDFLTAPETHPVFGRMVARQLHEIWVALDRPAPFVVREHGAGEGALALAILDGLAADESQLIQAIRYEPVEVEEARVEAFEARLADAGHATRIGRPGEVPITGVVLANEVLDALPVHRVRQPAAGAALEELFVEWREGRFVEVPGIPSTLALARRLEEEGIRLRDGQVAEICLAADSWIARAAASIERGVLLLLDYGHPAKELYGPRRVAGSLLAYAGHRVHDDVLANVGRQDLTAHVDLTAVERAATAAGLEALGTTTQARFLLALGIEDVLRAVQSDPATTPEAYLALRSGLVRLLDPRATGAFAVLALGRGLPADTLLRGFSG